MRNISIIGIIGFITYLISFALNKGEEAVIWYYAGFIAYVIIGGINLVYSDEAGRPLITMNIIIVIISIIGYFFFMPDYYKGYFTNPVIIVIATCSLASIILIIKIMFYDPKKPKQHGSPEYYWLPIYNKNGKITHHEYTEFKANEEE